MEDIWNIFLNLCCSAEVERDQKTSSRSSLILATLKFHTACSSKAYFPTWTVYERACLWNLIYYRKKTLAWVLKQAAFIRFEGWDSCRETLCVFSIDFFLVGTFRVIYTPFSVISLWMLWFSGVKSLYHWGVYWSKPIGHVLNSMWNFTNHHCGVLVKSSGITSEWRINGAVIGWWVSS